MANIQKIGVIGAGQMGRGIAQVGAMSGYSVILYDISEEGLKKGFEFIKSQLNKGLEKGKYTEDFIQKTLANLSLKNKLSDLSDCDLLIEAATENKNIKFEIFKALDEVAKKGAILATNTSSISITEIAAVT